MKPSSLRLSLRSCRSFGLNTNTFRNSDARSSSENNTASLCPSSARVAIRMPSRPSSQGGIGPAKGSGWLSSVVERAKSPYWLVISDLNLESGCRRLPIGFLPAQTGLVGPHKNVTWEHSISSTLLCTISSPKCIIKRILSNYVVNYVAKVAKKSTYVE